MKDTLTTERAASQLASVYDGSCFSYAGARAIVEYLEQLEDDCGFEIEFDPIAICCDYSEYPSLYEWAVDYGCINEIYSMTTDYDPDDVSWEDHRDNAIRGYIQDRGTLIEFESGIIVSSF